MRFLAKLPFERKPYAPMLYAVLLFDETKLKKMPDEMQKSGYDAAELLASGDYIGAFKLKNVLDLFSVHVFEDKAI